MLNEPFNLDTYNPYDYTNQSMYFNPFIKNETYYETVDPIIIKQIQNFKLTSILLEHRNLTDLTLLTKMGKVLENNKCIEKIYIKKCIISNITPIIKSLHINKTIKLISLKDSKINDLDELFKRLSENTDISLNILNLMNCNVSFTENFYNFIKKNKIIKFINLSKNEQINVPKFYEALKVSSFEIIHLCENKIDNLKHISEVLKFNKTIKELYLIYNEINDLSCLNECLPFNNTLEVLDLSFNNINNLNITLNSLQKNNSLKYLIMWNCNLKIIDEDLYDLFINKNIFLYINNNPINDII